MKVYESIKKDMCEINSPMEMAGYLDGIKVAATMFCKKQYPEEIIEEGGHTEISIYGMSYYLESKKV